MTFKKGAYDIYCPVPGHKALGMNVNITVGGGGTTTSKNTTAVASTDGGGGGGCGF